MKYYSAKNWIKNIETFRENLKKIDIQKANRKRNNAYTVAIEQLEKVLEGEMELEDVFLNPDNTLRNIIILSNLDKTDASTKK